MNVNRFYFPVIKKIKQLVVKKGRQPYRIPFGLYKGLKFNIDLQYELQIYLGLYERETYPYIRKISKQCDWMIDVGAGKGELCIFFLKSSNATVIYAFEPQLSETEIFNKNLELNTIDNKHEVHIFNKFIGATVNDEYMMLDDIRTNLAGRGFIKIDVEGFEMDVLRSGDSLITENVVDFLIETHSKKLEAECIKWLESKGYSTRIIDNAWWRAIIPEYRTIAHNRWLWATRN